jgi:hypothetical protein
MIGEGNGYSEATLTSARLRTEQAIRAGRPKNYRRRNRIGGQFMPHLINARVAGLARAQPLRPPHP